VQLAAAVDLVDARRLGRDALVADGRYPEGARRRGDVRTDGAQPHHAERQAGEAAVGHASPLAAPRLVVDSEEAPLEREDPGEDVLAHQRAEDPLDAGELVVAPQTRASQGVNAREGGLHPAQARRLGDDPRDERRRPEDDLD
jgi:hypothetical protein